MKSQRLLIISYYLIALTILYTKYASILRNERHKLDSRRLKGLLDKPLAAVQGACTIYYQDDAEVGRVAKEVSKKFSENAIESRLESLSEALQGKPVDDLVDLDRHPSILLLRGDPESDVQFDCRVKGGNTLVFRLHRDLSGPLVHRIFDLTKRLFFEELARGGEEKSIGLNVNFVLFSSVTRWDVKRQILEPFMNKVVNVLSLFYDVSVHSKHVNLDISSLLDSPEASILDLKKEDHVFYNFMEGVSNVDISLEDSHVIRERLNFFALVPEKCFHIHDDVSGSKRSSFMVDRLGIFAIINRMCRSEASLVGSGAHNDHNGQNDGQDHHNDHPTHSTNSSKKPRKHSDLLGDIAPMNLQALREDDKPAGQSECTLETPDPLDPFAPLSDDEAKELVSTWVTYVRKLFGLPPSLSEYAFSICSEGDQVSSLKVTGWRDANTFKVGDEFKLEFESPEHVAFYGFEVDKLLKRFQRTRVEKTLENLQTIHSLSNLHFMTQITQTVKDYTEDAMNALERIFAGDGNSAKLSKFAYKQTLEALGDDEMYYKNVLSFEHLFAVLMCDVFPFAFPTIVGMFKWVTTRMGSMNGD